MANTDAPTSSTAGAGGVGNSAQDEKRRSSPMFASLQQYKRESNPEAFKARQETLNESKPAESKIGSVWNSVMKDTGSK